MAAILRAAAWTGSSGPCPDLQPPDVTGILRKVFCCYIGGQLPNIDLKSALPRRRPERDGFRKGSIASFDPVRVPPCPRKTCPSTGPIFTYPIYYSGSSKHDHTIPTLCSEGSSKHDHLISILYFRGAFKYGQINLFECRFFSPEHNTVSLSPACPGDPSAIRMRVPFPGAATEPSRSKRTKPFSRSRSCLAW